MIVTTMQSELLAAMDAAQGEMERFAGESAKWQQRSMEIAARDSLVAECLSDNAAGDGRFLVPSRSRKGSSYTLTLFNRHGDYHPGELRCPCMAQSYGLPCGHAGAALLALPADEREQVRCWHEG